MTVEPETTALVAFLEDLRAIEEWADVEFELPETLNSKEARNVATVANTIRAGGRSVTWHDVEMVVDATEPLRDGSVVRVEHRVGAGVLGQVVELGYTRVDLHGYTIAATSPAPDDAGRYTVRLEPASEEAAQIFEHLDKSPTAAKPRTPRPPPPPPRKGKRKRKRGGKRKRRGR